MKLTTRKVAKQINSKYYYTAEPCVNGHVELRLTSNGKCVVCNKESAKLWAIKNNDRRKEINKAHMARNRQQYQEYSKIYRDKNRARVQAYQTARGAKYKAAKKKATPPWLSKEQTVEIRQIFLKAAFITKETGVNHQVDHIIPIQGQNVCGLHVPWNLQIITQSVNCSKQNKLLENL